MEARCIGDADGQLAVRGAGLIRCAENCAGLIDLLGIGSRSDRGENCLLICGQRIIADDVPSFPRKPPVARITVLP